MNNHNLPSLLSYTALVHAGSYKDFCKKLEKDYPDIIITHIKRKAIHYYIIELTEKEGCNYKKSDLYKLPLMGFREEFSNYIFFKNMKSYNNVLKIMCKSKENTDAPFLLFEEMLTALEKYRIGKITSKTKYIEYKIKSSENEPEQTIHTYNKEILSPETVSEVYKAHLLKVEGIEVNWIDEIKKQKPKIGIL